VQKPQHDRNWEVGQEKLPRFIVNGEHVIVENFRDFVWHDDGSADHVYRTEEFDMTQLEGVDVIVSHFAEYEGMAHIFVSFRFQDAKNMVISVETRREEGENFSPWLGLLRQFEIIYVVGSERDVIGVRTHVRNERVYIYPTVATKDQAQKLLSLLMQDVNAIYNKPVFYNTIFNNCTNAITRRVEDISDVKFPLTYRMLLPGFVDEILYEKQLIPHDKLYDQIKEDHRVTNDRIVPNNPDFSTIIRQREK
jgi:hypothetical protein